MQPLPYREHFFQSDGLQLRAVEWGDESAPPVVLLHGLRSYAFTWEPIAAVLADRFRLLALDQRGRGESAWHPQSEYHALAYVRDLEAMVSALGIGRHALVGHSMGGANAIVFAARHPELVRSLVLEDMGPGASLSSAGADRIKRELAATPARFADLQEGRAWWRSQRPLISEAALDSRVAHSLKAGPDGQAVWRHDAHGIATARLAATAESLIDLWPEVERLRMPVLLVRGGRSDFLSAETAAAMVERNPNISRVDIEGASHYVHDDRLDAFNAQVEAFLEKTALRG